MLPVMPLLILNISNYRVQLRTRIGKRSKPILPIESAFDPPLTIYKISRSGFDVADQTRKRSIWSLSNQDVNVIRHVVDGDQFVLLIRHDSCDVSLKIVVMFRIDKVLPTFDGKHDLYVDLRVGVSHDSPLR